MILYLHFPNMQYVSVTVYSQYMVNIYWHFIVF